MMPYFIQRPQVIEAIQWTGNNLSEIETWTSTKAPHLKGRFKVDNDQVLTIQDDMSLPCKPGDWITQVGIVSAENLALGMQQIDVPTANYTVSQRTGR